MKNKKTVIIVGILIVSSLFVYFNNNDVKAWSGGTHDRILDQAIEIIKLDFDNGVLPSNYDSQVLQDLWDELDNNPDYVDEIKRGTTVEDSSWIYQKDHGWDPVTLRGFFVQDTFGVGAAFKIEDYFSYAHRVYVGGSFGGLDYTVDKEEAWFYFGRALHLLQDVCNPHHAALKWPTDNNKHYDFETYVASTRYSVSSSFSCIDSAISNYHNYYAGPPQRIILRDNEYYYIDHNIDADWYDNCVDYLTDYPNKEFQLNSLYYWIDNTARISSEYCFGIETTPYGSSYWQLAADKTIELATRLTAGLLVYFWCHTNDLDFDGDGLTTLDELDSSSCEASGYLSNYAIQDSDNDGLNDDEEILYGTSPDKRDSDGDFASDYREIYQYNTDPCSKDSYNPTEDSLHNDLEETIGYDTSLRDTDQDGLNDYDEYRYWYYSKAKWYNDIDGDGIINLLDPDADNDGLLDGDEVLYNSELWMADTDLDGISDKDEAQYWLDNYVLKKPQSDIDGDRLSNLRDPDSDDDGLSDYDEIITYNTDPATSDTDGDGLTDFEEVLTHGTDPTNEDTDGDSLIDFFELENNINPLLADSDSDLLTDDFEYNYLNDRGIDPFGNIDLYKGDYLFNIIDPDMDGDGLTDGWEYATLSNLDPDLRYDFTEYTSLDGSSKSDGQLDPDADDLKNSEEEQHGTDYTNNDSDNDGLLDGEEVNGDYGYITNPNNPDTDGDLLDDLYEITYGLDPTDYNSDADLDGLPDSIEISTHNTDPFEPDTDNDGLTDFEEVIGFIDANADCIIDSEEFHGIITDPLAYDSDMDGLSDSEEIVTFDTDPNNGDTDNDYMSDGWETDYGLDPLVDDRYQDKDSDSLNNLGEYSWNTNPNVVDTDGDSLSDGLEVNTYNTNPLNTDSDNDGWSDGFEVSTSGTDPLDTDTDSDGIADKTEYNWWVNTYGQSSSSAYAKIKDHDSDNDGLSDGYEKNHGINPLDSDHDNDGLSDGYEVSIGTDPKDSDTDNDGYSDGWEIDNGYDPTDPNSKPGGFGWW